ncbi:hypothetical protein [Amaricoccus macauensis]|uniref:hypothetical protein n=1 Tax=Amaricoccus macauensis TaxID=57001 RepID=UPI003C7AF812
MISSISSGVSGLTTQSIASQLSALTQGTESATSFQSSEKTTAAPPPPPPPPPPKETSETSDADLESLFEALLEETDTDEDGTISATELAAAEATDSGEATEGSMAGREFGPPPPPPPSAADLTGETAESETAAASPLEALQAAMANDENATQSATLAAGLTQRFLETLGATA